MEPKELQAERVSLLRRLKQHPGWEAYQARLQQLLTEREREKAAHLRRGDAQKAVITQGQVDGLQEAWMLIDAMITDGTVEDNGAPAY